MEEIIANEGFIFKICKQLMQAQYQKNKQPSQKMSTRPKQTFLLRRDKVANKHMKTCSTSLIIREMQIKTRVKSHFISIKMELSKKEILLHCWWECK